MAVAVRGRINSTSAFNSLAVVVLILLSNFVAEVSPQTMRRGQGGVCAAARTTLERALLAQEREDYSTFYRHLSERFKYELRTKDSVQNTGDYKKFRLESETEWRAHSVLKMQRLNDRKCIGLVRSQVYSLGEQENLTVRYVLVREDGWKIDSWDYVKGQTTKKNH